MKNNRYILAVLFLGLGMMCFNSCQIVSSDMEEKLEAVSLESTLDFVVEKRDWCRFPRLYIRIAIVGKRELLDSLEESCYRLSSKFEPCEQSTTNPIFRLDTGAKSGFSRVSIRKSIYGDTLFLNGVYEKILTSPTLSSAIKEVEGFIPVSSSLIISCGENLQKPLYDNGKLNLELYLDDIIISKDDSTAMNYNIFRDLIGE